MKRVPFPVILLLAAVAWWSASPLAQAQSAPAGAGGGRLIEILGTDSAGKYLFEPSTIQAKPGELIRVRLKSVSKAMASMPKAAMSHNFVLLQAKVDAMQFATASISAGLKGNYVASDKGNQVIAATALAGVGETVEVSFKAPSAGTYPYICTFPGHLAAGMKGSLIVK